MKKRPSIHAPTTTAQPIRGIRIQSGVKAGGLYTNHNESQLRIKSGVKSGGLKQNHNESRLRIKSGVKAGGLKANHNETLLVAR